MDSPVIQLRFKGRLVQTFSFQGDVLRIGRMRENDIVISNASVSRFHAVLKREEGRVILEDSGSENGCYLNGTRVVDSVALEAGDEILIGKHELLLAEAGSEEEVPEEAASHGKSDAWDASNTYFVEADVQAKMVEGSGSEPVADLEEEDDSLLPTELESAAEEQTAPQELEPPSDDSAIESAASLCEDEEAEPMDLAAEPLEAWPRPTDDAAQEDEPDEGEPLPEQDEESGESPFAFGIDADLASSERRGELEVDPEDYDVDLTDSEPEERGEPAVESAEPPPPELPSPEEPTWYAGLIIQNQGKLERIISWDQDRLSAGRSRECEMVLDQAGVSRRHAMFVREDGRYQVRDLDSANGVLVNGEKIRRHDLEVGDIVKIEDFEVTFLLDRQPIASEIVTDELAAPSADAPEDSFDMTMIDEHFPSSSAITDPGLGEESAALVEEEAEMPEESLFGPEESDKEELVEVEELSPPPCEIAEPAVQVSTDDFVTFEVRVCVEDLPLALRTALAEVDQGELRLPVQLVLKTDSEQSNQS